MHELFFHSIYYLLPVPQLTLRTETRKAFAYSVESCQAMAIGMRQKRKKIPYGSKLPVYLSEKELHLIREHTFFDPDFGRLAVVERGKFKLELSLDDIDEVLGYIAAAANHTNNKKVQRELDLVYDKLQKLLDEYDEQEE